ncbi:MAG: hypothetical protein GY796_26680 [Chloroflexi bacterium]|nr:hypothetical protein [Chloroflexota bacterium]
MSDPNQMSRSKTIEYLASQLDGPMALDVFVEQVLQLWHSSAKNPQAGVRQGIRNDYEGNVLLFLDKKTIISPSLALKDVRFRVPLTAEELEASCLRLTPSFLHIHQGEALYQELEADDFHFVKADGSSLPTHFVKYTEEVETLFGSQEIERIAFDLTHWQPFYDAQLEDSIIITILDWANGRYQLDLETTQQRQMQAAVIDQRNQLLADTLYDLLESAGKESIWAKRAIMTTYAQLPKDEVVPDHWLWALRADGRMVWGGHDIRYASDSRLNMANMIFGFEAEPEAEAEEIPLSPEKKQQVYRFKAYLKHRKGLWRRIEIQGGQTLEDLDDILHSAFNHDWDHLSGFWQLIRRGKGHRYREMELATIYPFSNDGFGKDTAVASLELEPGNKLKYVYDFGDWVDHRLELEAINAPEPGAEYPRQVEQNKPRYRYCPHCKERGEKNIATWICIECSTYEGRQILICEDCLMEYHEDHYAEEKVY